MSEASARGFMEVRLTGPYADLIWATMNTAGCAPDAALGYLLDVARGEMESGAWDGSTASQTAVLDVQVKHTNLEDITHFLVGQLVVAEASNVHGRPQVIGKIRDLGPTWAHLELTAGTKARMNHTTGDDLYSVRLTDLQEL